MNAAWPMYEIVDAGWTTLDGASTMTLDEIDAAHHAMTELARARAAVKKGTRGS